MKRKIQRRRENIKRKERKPLNKKGWGINERKKQKREKVRKIVGKERKRKKKKEKERTYTKVMLSRRFENIIFLIKKTVFCSHWNKINSNRK